MTQEYTRGVSTRLSEEMHQEVSDLANKEHRPLSNLVRVLITEALLYRKLGVSDQELQAYLEVKKQGAIPIQAQPVPPPYPKQG